MRPKREAKPRVATPPLRVSVAEPAAAALDTAEAGFGSEGYGSEQGKDFLMLAAVIGDS
jgi:hypothetical protein